MDFLKRNSGKIALLAIIAFFTLPFIYGNEEEEDFSPFAVKSGMSYQANPISKLANKIASFYGFSKPGPQMSDLGNGTNSIKRKISFGEENPFDHHAKNKTKISKDTLVASARNSKNFDSDFSGSKTYHNKKSSDALFSNSYADRADNPVKGYVQVNGQNYAVIEDATGERYIVTPKGHIPYKELMQRAISEQEFNTKKQLTGADDIEVLRALQQEKNNQAYSGNTNRQNYQSSSTSYRNGALSNMGGMSYARVSASDKGFDNNVLSDAYDNLKGINLKMERGVSSSYAKGVSYSADENFKDSFDSQGIKSDVEQRADVLPANVAKVTQLKMKEDILSNQKNPRKSNLRNDEHPKNIQEQEIDTSQLPEIKDLGKGKSGYVILNDSTEGLGLFVEIHDENNVYSDDWGLPVEIEISEQKVSGIILPKITGTTLQLPELEDETVDLKQINNNIEKINNSIEQINNLMTFLPNNVKVYIGNADKPSQELMEQIMTVNMPDGKVVNFMTDDRKAADIVLPGLVLTPTSFNQFVREFIIQTQQLFDSQAENKPV